MIDLDQLTELTGTARRVVSDGIAAGLGGVDGATLTEVALTARRLRETADRLEVHALAALEESGYTDQRDGTPTAGWFAGAAHLPSGVTRSQVRTGRILARHLDVVDQAWADGTITSEHVKVLVNAANPRIRDVIEAAQGDLLALADGRTFHRWHQAIRAAVAALDHDGPDPGDPTHTTASFTRSGLFAELRLRLGGPDVEVLEQIIETKTNELYHHQRRDRTHSTDLPNLSRAQLRALAIIELLLHGHGADLTTAKKPAASIHLVLRYPAATTNGLPDLHTTTPTTRTGTGTVTGPSRLTGLVGLPSLADPLWSLTNLNGEHLALEHLDTLLCDCVAHTLLVDHADNPLHLGTAARHPTRELRRAVLIRDGGCAFPGCDCPTGWVDIHHVRRAADGGPTDIDNLVALCRRHHGVTHRNGWTLHATGDGWFWWASPSGHTFWSQRHGTQRAGPAPPTPLDTAA